MEKESGLGMVNDLTRLLTPPGLDAWSCTCDGIYDELALASPMGDGGAVAGSHVSSGVRTRDMIHLPRSVLRFYF